MPAKVAALSAGTPAQSMGRIRTERALSWRRGGHFQRTTATDLHTRVQAKIDSLANSAAARATCRLAAAARRSQARRGAQPTQDAGLHPWPRLCPAHGRLAARVRGRRAVVEDVGVRPPDRGGNASGHVLPGCSSASLVWYRLYLESTYEAKKGSDR